MQKKVRIGVAPTKRGFLSMEAAKRQKDKFMAVIRAVKPDRIELIDIDDVCENGIAFRPGDIAPAVSKLKMSHIDALFVPHCDFGEESVITEIAAAMNVPTLLWGARDERPNSAEARGRDTQCGMFASSKVLMRRGVKFSYIFNCETESGEFRDGFETFARVAAVLKSLTGLRIAKIGARPASFMSVMTDEAQLLTKLGILTVPIAPVQIATLAKKLIADGEADFAAYYADVTARIDFSSLAEESAKNTAAVVVAIKKLMIQNNCAVGALECWSAFNGLIGITPCLAVGELADSGLPLSCETDVSGAITLAILQAASLWEDSPFFADLTIRHPANDNAELLWHCGPFPYSLKDPACPAKMVGPNEHWELKKGEITICRFDELYGKFYLFGGEGRAVDGPETTGTYVWFEVDDWKNWEEHLIFGPYIHHVGGIYGNYQRVLQEVANFLPNLTFDSPEIPGRTAL